MKQQRSAKLSIVTSMVIFGTIGLFVRHVSLPSSLIALVRGVIGVAFLLIVMKLRGLRLNRTGIRHNLVLLLISGAAIGFNWILLFESYRYTSVAVSTLCYYMAPILVIAVSPLVLKERLTGFKLLCVAAALFGMVLVSGVLQSGEISRGDITGILFGLAAAVLYASVVLMNKHLHDISAFDRTIMQLGVSAVALIPYCLLTVDGSALHVDGLAVGLLIVMGIVHTGLAYFLYFGAMDHVSGQSAALISYVDPVVAVLISVFLLREPMNAAEMIGAVLVIGAAFCSEMPGKRGERP